MTLKQVSLVPLGIEVLLDGARPFLDLAHLDSDIGVARPSLVLGDEALSADHGDS